MSVSREYLLTPSLTEGARPTASIYSVNTTLLTAFLGGPVGIIMLGALNSWRLKRLVDAPLHLLALGGLIAFIHAVFQEPPPAAVAWVIKQIGGSVVNLYAMLLCAGYYVLHRQQHKATRMFGIAPSPWIAGIACIVLGRGLHQLIFLAIKHLSTTV